MLGRATTMRSPLEKLKKMQESRPNNDALEAR
jgi:choline transport protein